MMADILVNHQPNRRLAYKQLWRSEFRTCHRMTLKAHLDGDWKKERQYGTQANNALVSSLDNNRFSRRWYMYH